jgi:Methyltransferase domain
MRSGAIPVPDLSSPAAHPEPTVPAMHTPERKQIYLGVTAPTRNSEEAILSNSYDVVVCEQVLEHLPKIDFSFKTLVRILKTDGKLGVWYRFCYHLYI